MKKTLMILITGLAFTFFAAYAFAADERDVEIHGFVSQGYIFTTENNFIADSKDSTFEFNEMGINFGKKLTRKLHIGIQFFARDFGEIGNNEIKIDWALADYRFKDWLGLRFGQLKAPHGFYNEYRDVDALRTFIFLPQSIYQEVTRDVTLSIQGGGIYGAIDMSAAGRLSYQALYGTQSIDPNSRLSENLAGYPQSSIDNDTTTVDKKYAGSLIWDTPLRGLRLGVTYDNTEMSLVGHWNKDILIFTEGDPVTLDYDTYENWVYSMEFTWQNLVLMGEYISNFRKYETFTGKGEHTPTGWYAGATYRLTDWFELGGYYATLDSDSSFKEGPLALPGHFLELSDICVTTRFDINPFWTFKLEYHTFDGAFGLSALDNLDPTGSRDYFQKDWTMFAAKLTVAF